MDKKVLRNVMLGCFFLGNGLSGTEIPDEETKIIPQEERAEKTSTDKLFRAIALKDKTHLEDLLKKGANPNQVTFSIDKESGKICDSTTPLIFAAIFGNSEVIQILLTNGANVNLGNSDGTTPLHAAMHIDNFEHVKRVEILLGQGANPNARDADGCTPLMALAEHILELTRLRELARGNEEENTTQGFSQGISCGFQVLELLTHYDADINAQDNNGNSVLVRAIPWCARYLNLELIKKLIKLGAAVNFPNNDGYKVLDHAIVHKKVAENMDNRKLADEYDQVIELLLVHGATKGHPKNETESQPQDEDETEDKAADGYTLEERFFYALLNLNKEAARDCIAQGYDPNAKNDKGWTSLHVILWQAYLKKENLSPIIQSRLPKITQLLIKCGADVNARDNQGTTPLALATRLHAIQIIQILLDNGADIY
ncbi:MAG: ankyrin repeat domain-containing protein [Holosporaceae bacterium]|jgi:ankyrin repeat protein|nr:ankyrin repeat domain-containing protein [Holosporaceae bacterium]